MRGVHRRRRALACVVGLVLGAVAALREGHADPPAPATRLGLAACLDRAERNSPGLVAAMHKIGAAEAQLDEAWVAPFFPVSVQGFASIAPTARGNPTYSPDAFGQNPFDTQTGYIARLTVDTGVPISPWTWVRLGHVRDAARAGVRASREEREKARLELRANVRKAYYGLQFAHDSLYLLDRADGYLDAAQRHIEEARESGTASANGENDSSQLRLARADLRARRAEATRAERVTRITLGLLTGAGEDFDIVDEPLCPLRGDLGPLGRHVARAVASRPEVAMLQAGIAARRAAVSIQQYAYYPDLFLGLTAAVSSAPTIADQPNPFAANNVNYAYWGAGIGLRWTFDPLANRQRVRRLSEELSMTEAQQRLALGGMRVEVIDAYERAAEWREREAAWNDGEGAGYEWFTRVFQGFQSGAVETGDLLTPLQRYLLARFSHLQAIFELDAALSQLAYVTGQADPEGTADDTCATHPHEREHREDPVAAPDEGSGDPDVDALLRATQTAPAAPATTDAGAPADAATPRPTVRHR